MLCCGTFIHSNDLAQGHGRVEIPDASGASYPAAERERMWQYVFPGAIWADGYRKHIHQSCLQKAIKYAAHMARIPKRVTCHTLRHSFTTHLLENGYNIRIIQELLGHKDVSTMMLYMHVVEHRPLTVRSPLDDMMPSSAGAGICREARVEPYGGTMRNVFPLPLRPVPCSDAPQSLDGAGEQRAA